MSNPHGAMGAPEGSMQGNPHAGGAAPTPPANMKAQ
jgi:hypothetical protein